MEASHVRSPCGKSPETREACRLCRNSNREAHRYKDAPIWPPTCMAARLRPALPPAWPNEPETQLRFLLWLERVRRPGLKLFSKPFEDIFKDLSIVKTNRLSLSFFTAISWPQWICRNVRSSHSVWYAHCRRPRAVDLCRKSLRDKSSSDDKWRLDEFQWNYVAFSIQTANICMSKASMPIAANLQNGSTTKKSVSHICSGWMTSMKDADVCVGPAATSDKGKKICKGLFVRWLRVLFPALKCLQLGESQRRWRGGRHERWIHIKPENLAKTS